MTVMEQRLDPPSRFYKQENNGNVTTVQLPPKINKIIKKRDVQIKQEPMPMLLTRQHNQMTSHNPRLFQFYFWEQYLVDMHCKKHFPFQNQYLQ